jgi:septum site-determining protein MinC
VIVDCGSLPSTTPDVAGLMHAIVSRGIHIIGMEGAHASWPGLELWGRPLPGGGKPGKPIEIAEPAAPAAPPPRAAAPAQAAAPSPDQASLLIDHSIRSGQSVSFETGDVTILGSVASGAEVVAGGSIHVYGALRGRAIAGLAGNSAARIYCSKLNAELVAIDGVYLTADDMPKERIGAPSCAWLDGDLMRITPID